jgi:hypothetical protein
MESEIHERLAHDLPHRGVSFEQHDSRLAAGFHSLRLCSRRRPANLPIS